MTLEELKTHINTPTTNMLYGTETLIPCRRKSDRKVGFYDTVEKEFVAW